MGTGNCQAQTMNGNVAAAATIMNSTNINPCRTSSNPNSGNTNGPNRIRPIIRIEQNWPMPTTNPMTNSNNSTPHTTSANSASTTLKDDISPYLGRYKVKSIFKSTTPYNRQWRFLNGDQEEYHYFRQKLNSVLPTTTTVNPIPTSPLHTSIMTANTNTTNSPMSGVNTISNFSTPTSMSMNLNLNSSINNPTSTPTNDNTSRHWTFFNTDHALNKPKPAPKIEISRKNPSKREIKYGRYQMLRHLGTGSFATVHLAKDIKTGDLVAMKFMDKTNFEGPEASTIYEEIELMKVNKT